MKKRWKVVLILVAVVCFAISLSYPLKYKMEEKSTEAGMEKLIAMRDAGMAKRGERGDGRQEATVEEAGEEGAGETEPQAESERPEGTAPSDSEGEEAEAESEPSEEAEATEASAPVSEPSEEVEATEPTEPEAAADEAAEAAESEAAVAVNSEAEGESPEAQAVMAAQEAPVAAATQEQPGEEAEAAEPSEPSEAAELSDETEAAEPSEVTEPSEETEAAEPSEVTEPSEATEPSEEAESTEPAEATEPSGETEATEPAEAAEPAEASESAEVTIPSEAEKPGEEAEAAESSEGDESGAEPETLPVAGAQGEGAAQVLPGPTKQPVPTMDYGPTPIPTPTSMPTATPSPTATPVPTPTPNRFERTGAEPYAQKVKRTLDESKILPQFQEIYAENKDFAGWITIPDTVIDYPVVQTEDSDYYLHHDFFGDKNANGQIILDTKCDPYTPSYNLVISGHSMRSGKMFGRLVNYMDESYWEKHKLVYFDTLMDERTYVVLAAFFSADYDVDETGFRYNADIQYSVEAKQWLREIEENELYDTGIDAEFGDEFLTLTTCNKAHRSDGRFVVVCRRLRAGEEIE